jgi:hypothetical protein
MQESLKRYKCTPLEGEECMLHVLAIGCHMGIMRQRMYTVK